MKYLSKEFNHSERKLTQNLFKIPVQYLWNISCI
jgi:hypothetical protein